MNSSGQPKPFVRAFIAVEIGDEVHRRLAEAQASLKKAGAHVAWVSPANIHLSLAFLGNVTREMVPLIAMALDEAAEPVKPFSLEVLRVGQFGSERSPRILWAGVRESPDLMLLQARVAAGLRALEFSLEERAYRPHLTLGRVRSARGREKLVKALAMVSDVEFGTVDVREAVLMQSNLRPAGADYVLLYRARCGA